MSSTPLPTGRSAPRTRLTVQVLALCWLVVMFDGLDMFVYGAVLPHLLTDPGLGLTPVVAGEIGSCATFGMLIGALASGTVSDWIGRKKVMLLGMALFSLASAACALATSAEAFGVARFVAGVGLGGLLPTAIALVMEYAPRGRTSLTVAGLMTAHHAGGILATALSLWLVPAEGWRLVFWLGALPLVIAVPLVLVYLPESMGFLVAKGRRAEATALAARHRVELSDFVEPAAKETGGALVNLRALFTRSAVWSTVTFWLASFAGLLLVYGVSTWLPTMMRGAGYALGSSVSFLLVINFGGVAGMLVAGRLADRFGARRIAIIWFVLTAVGVGLLGVKMPLTATYVLVFLTGLWLFSAQTMVYAAVGQWYPASSRATAIGWTSGIGRFGAVFGPWIGGVLAAGQSPEWGFAVFAAAGVVGAVALLLVPTVRPEAPPGLAPAPQQHQQTPGHDSVVPGGKQEV